MVLLSAEDIHKSYPLGSDRLHILEGVIPPGQSSNRGRLSHR